MKKIIALVFLTGISSVASAKTITLVIPDGDIAIVENDVVDAEQWIQQMWAGKLSKCSSRAARQYEEYAKKAGLLTVPTDEKAKAAALLVTPGYKSRKVRQAEDDAKLPK